MKAISKIITLAFFAVLIVTTTQAHSNNQPPFFKINGSYAGYYNIFFSSNFIDVPKDAAPTEYIVDNDINFEIDKSQILLSPKILDETVYSWDFGDGAKSTGLVNSHKYKNPGSYILKINSQYKNEDPQNIEAVIINVKENEKYKTPRANIIINDNLDKTQQKTSFDQVIKLDASKSSTQNGIQKVVWDLNDESMETGITITRKFGNIPFARILARVYDNNGLFSETYVIIQNTSYVSETKPTNLVNSSENKQSTKVENAYLNFIAHFKNYLANALDTNQKNVFYPLIVLAVFVAGAFHALTPGHGKSLMSAFLLSRKNGSFKDVAVLAATMTITHTLIIYVLGVIFLYLNSLNSLYKFLPLFEKMSAVIVLLIGYNLVSLGIKNIVHNLKHKHIIDHEHQHDHDHEHTHNLDFNKTPVQIIIAGISGGLVPCPDALAILFLAAGAHKIVTGLILVAVFSLGLAFTILAIGTMLLATKNKLMFSDKIEVAAETYFPLISGIILFIIATGTIL